VVLRDFNHYHHLTSLFRLSSKDPVASCIHNAKVCRKHGRLDLYKVWYLAVEILRGCVPAELPNRLVTDGHQVLVESLESKRILDENYQRDQQLEEVKSLLYQSSILPEMRDLQADAAIVSKPMRRVKWGMHPLGQKLVDDL
jgi:hypothetical protein